MSTAIIVPARLGSQRFPRKLLAPVGGSPLILWTARRLQTEAPGIPIVFAVAETELADVLEAEGYRTVLTDPALPSGTDRIAAANREVGAEVVINVQADEPLVSATQLQALTEALEGGQYELATIARPFPDLETYLDPNKVKVLRSRTARALYFSRAALPSRRETGDPVGKDWLARIPVYWHQGLYAYTAKALEAFVALPPSPMEEAERLEQLRWLENGGDIHVSIVEHQGVGIDTPEDLAIFEQLLS